MLNLGKETKVRALGREWTFSRVTLGRIREFKAWVKWAVGDPFAVVERFAGRLSETEVARMVKEAEATVKDLESFTLGSPLAQKWMRTEEGAAELARILLAEHHPDIDADSAFAVLSELGGNALAKAVADGSGHLPAKNVAGPDGRAESTGTPSTAG